MNFSIKSILITKLILIFVSMNAFANQNISQKGSIHGHFYIDTIWQSIAYLSHIENFDAMFSMSSEMIIEKTIIDSLGNFSFSTDFLPEEDKLYRIHFVKKGDPPASIIIGGKEENHFFIIANHHTYIKIQNTDRRTITYHLSFSGDPTNTTFQQVQAIASDIDSLIFNYPSSKKDFMKKAMYEEYRFVADTSTHPLISLYSIYKSKFESNYSSNIHFYRAYLKKWGGNNSSYFNAFRKQLPGNRNNRYILLALIAIIFLVFGFFMGKLKYLTKVDLNQLKKLTVQERKIFNLIQQGITNQEISDSCNIGMSTVKSHVSSIYSKLKIKSRKDAMNIKYKYEKV